MSHYTRLRKCKKLGKWKKSNVTSSSSTCVFNKKNNKKYYQYYDNDTENTMIDSVNDDCLAEIFTYLPACERPKIALVCKKWKKVLGFSWLDVKKLELTHWEYDECPSFLHKYPTIDEQINFLRLLLNKCGRYLKELDLTAYGSCNIVPVINKSCPNLVKLQLRFQHVEHKVLINAFSRLSKLKVLKIIFQNIHNNGYIPVTLINSLKSIAGTLTELTLLSWNNEFLFDRCRFPKTFTRVIPKLKALKSIETAGLQFDADLDVQLNHFGISVISNDRRHYNLSVSNTDSFKNIKALTIRVHQVTDDFIYTIANCLKQLEKFDILCEKITDISVVTISKMTNLNTVLFHGPNNVIGSSMELLKNLKFLRLPYSNKIADDLVTKILENSPEMEWFCIMDSPITSKFIKKAAEIATNRNKNLMLCVPNMPDIKKYQSSVLHLLLFDSSKNMVYDSRDIDNTDN